MAWQIVRHMRRMHLAGLNLRPLLWFSLICVSLLSAGLYLMAAFSPDTKTVATSDTTTASPQMLDYDTGPHRVNGAGNSKRKLFDKLEDVPLRYTGMESTMLTGKQVEAVRRMSLSGLNSLIRDHLSARGLQTEIYNEKLNSYEALLTRHVIDRFRYGLQTISWWQFQKSLDSKQEPKKVKFSVSPKAPEPVGQVKIFSSHDRTIAGKKISLHAIAFPVSEKFYATGLVSIPEDRVSEEPILYLSLPGCGESLNSRSEYGQIQNRMAQAAAKGVIGFHIELFCNNGMMALPENNIGTLNYPSIFGFKYGASDFMRQIIRQGVATLESHFGIKRPGVYVTGHSAGVVPAKIAAQSLANVKGLILVGATSEDPLGCGLNPDRKLIAGEDSSPQDDLPHFSLTANYWSYWYPQYLIGNREFKASSVEQHRNCERETLRGIETLFVIGLQDPTSTYKMLEEEVKNGIQLEKIGQYSGDDTIFYSFVEGQHHHGLARSGIALDWLLSRQAKDSEMLIQDTTILDKALANNTFIEQDILFPGYEAWKKSEGVLTVERWVKRFVLTNFKPNPPANPETAKTEIIAELSPSFWGSKSDLKLPYVSERATLHMHDDFYKVEFVKIPVNEMLYVVTTIITPSDNISPQKPIIWGSTRYLLPSEEELDAFLMTKRPILLFSYLGHSTARDDAYSPGVFAMKVESYSSLHGLAYASVSRFIEYYKSRLTPDKKVEATLYADGLTDSVYGQIVGSLIEDISSVHIRNGIKSISEFLERDPLPQNVPVLFAGNLFHNYDLPDFVSLDVNTKFYFDPEHASPDWGIFGPYR